MKMLMIQFSAVLRFDRRGRTVSHLLKALLFGERGLAVLHDEMLVWLLRHILNRTAH